MIHVSDLPHSGSIKFLGDENATVAHVTVMKEEAPAPEAVAAAPTEPEVAKKGKTELPKLLRLPMRRTKKKK